VLDLKLTYILFIMENTTEMTHLKKKYRGKTYKRMQTHNLKTTVLIHSLRHLLKLNEVNEQLLFLGFVFLGYVVFQPVSG
jgi:dsRNA-specific ribonuclease